MCNLSEGVEQKGIQKGILESIGNLMDTMNWTAKEAMDALKIKAEERSLYEKLLIQFSEFIHGLYFCTDA